MKKTGVVLCRCNQLNNSIDFTALEANLRGRKEPVPVLTLSLACHPAAAHVLKAFVEEEGIGKLVIAACSPNLKGAYFQELVQDQEITQHYLTVVNIREDCAWAHGTTKEATAKALNLLNMGLERLKKVKDVGQWGQDRAVVNKLKCDKCKRCLEECPNEAIVLDGKGYPEVTEKCQKCGVCLGGCPLGVIILPHFRLEEISAMLTPLSKIKESPVAVGFFCPHAYEEAGRALSQGQGYPPSLYIIPVPCAGAVNMILVNDAISQGLDGIIVAGCAESQCQNRKGNNYAEKRIKNQQLTLEEMFLEKERLLYMTFGEQYHPVAQLDQSRCSKCQSCLPVCPFGAITYQEARGQVEINKKKCRACGTCTAACPSGVIQLPVATDGEILASIDLLASSGW